VLANVKALERADLHRTSRGSGTRNTAKKGNKGRRSLAAFAHEPFQWAVLES
jgi:hypothetical protein